MTGSKRVGQKGFTLIELMIVVFIIGVLAAIAYPAYRDYVLKSKRSDALTEMAAIAGAQEKFYAQNLRYAGTINILPGYTLEPNPYVTDEGLYNISNALTLQGYRLTANAQGDQTAYTKCPSIVLDSVGTRSPAHCW
jgi:type IV pilus assembly protein PilE